MRWGKNIHLYFLGEKTMQVKNTGAAKILMRNFLQSFSFCFRAKDQDTENRYHKRKDPQGVHVQIPVDAHQNAGNGWRQKGADTTDGRGKTAARGAHTGGI